MKKLKFQALLCLGLLIGLGLQVQAQQTGKQTVAMLKESPAGSKIITFVNAINKGETVTDELVQSIMSDALLKKAGMAQLKNMMENDIPENDGKLTVYKVERVEMRKFELYALGSKSNEWVKMDFTIMDGRPYKIRGIGVDIVDKPGDVGEPMKFD